jgi:hypothetical protein
MTCNVRAIIHHRRPVLVQIEGITPTEDKLEQCRQLWSVLHETFGFNMATFCPTLLPYQCQIMGPSNVEIPA